MEFDIYLLSILSCLKPLNSVEFKYYIISCLTFPYVLFYSFNDV